MKSWLSRLWLSAFMMACTIPVFAEPVMDDSVYSVEGERYQIELGAYSNKMKQSYDGHIVMIVPQNVRFNGKLKAMPAKKKTSYLAMALNMMQVRPTPKVEHQMFIEAEDGQVLAVYADSRIVPLIQSHLELEQQAHWYGYHIYSFSRGAAVVIENFEIKE